MKINSGNQMENEIGKKLGEFYQQPKKSVPEGFSKNRRLFSKRMGVGDFGQFRGIWGSWQSFRTAGVD